jgi:hypothetical protein
VWHTPFVLCFFLFAWGEVVFIFICVWIFVPYTFSSRLVQVWQIVTHCAHLSLSLSLSFFLSTFLPPLPPVVACLASSGGCPTMYPSTYLLWTSTMYHLLLSYLYATWFFGNFLFSCRFCFEIVCCSIACLVSTDVGERQRFVLALFSPFSSIRLKKL